jgi:Spy/CpxP family protein refolding chaperone
VRAEIVPLTLNNHRCFPSLRRKDLIMRNLTAALLAGSLILAAPAMAQEVSDANMEILKQKLKADKKLLVAGNMDLSDAEAKKFWPIYDAYQKDLEQLNQKLGQTIKEYAEAFNKGPIQDDKAKKLMNEVLSVEEQETKLKRSYAEKLEKVLPFAKVARYIQMETKIRSLVRMELAQQIPLVY